MNRRRTLFFVGAGLVLGCGVGFILYSKKTEPLLKLQIVRRLSSKESRGLFKIEGAEK
jgi:hypothetical protein